MIKRLLTGLALVLMTNSVFALLNCPIMAVDVIRHGDRTTDTEMRLIPLGMQHSYQLGNLFRERYINSCQLLPKIYDRHSIFVRSTDYQRSLLTAEAVMDGLYPLGTGPKVDGEYALPSGPTLIPIHSVPRATDVILSAEAGDALVKQIGLFFQAKIAKQTPLDFVLYSSHDSVLSRVFGALGIKKPITRVPYNSDISFRLYSDNVVRVFFNGSAIAIPKCDDKTTCSLIQFAHISAGFPDLNKDQTLAPYPAGEPL